MFSPCISLRPPPHTGVGRACATAGPPVTEACASIMAQAPKSTVTSPTLCAMHVQSKASPRSAHVTGILAAVAAACCMAMYVLVAEQHVAVSKRHHNPLDATSFLLIRMVRSVVPSIRRQCIILWSPASYMPVHASHGHACLTRLCMRR